MKSKLLADQDGMRTFVVVLDDGDEAFAALSKFATSETIGGASLTALGAFKAATVGWFDFASKSYRKIPIGEQCEVLSLIGDVAIGDDGKATGTYQDFMTGFVVDADNVWGRPVGVAVSPDGALFVSEDGSGTIWKVTKD